MIKCSLALVEARTTCRRVRPQVVPLSGFQSKSATGRPVANKGEPIETCAIITTDANEVMQKVHNRMPVIVDPKNYDEWLDRELQDPELLQRLLQPYPAKKMRLVPVSTLVNSPRNDNPRCVAAVSV